MEANGSRRRRPPYTHDPLAFLLYVSDMVWAGDVVSWSCVFGMRRFCFEVSEQEVPLP